MKRKLFYTGNYTTGVDIAIFILRVVAGSFMLTHGWMKLVNVIKGPPYEFADPIGLGVTLSLILVAFAEGICSVLVALGFAVRLSAIPPVIAMLVAGFVTHGSDPFSSKELSLLYATVFLVIAITGAGKISFDRLLEKVK